MGDHLLAWTIVVLLTPFMAPPVERSPTPTRVRYPQTGSLVDELSRGRHVGLAEDATFGPAHVDAESSVRAVESRASEEKVVAGEPEEPVVAGLTEQPVVAELAEQPIVARSAD